MAASPDRDRCVALAGPLPVPPEYNSMENMHEIVDLRAFAAVITWLAVALPVAGVVIGAIAGAAKKALVTGLWKGLALGLMGPLIYALWLLYAYLIRYDPVTGYCGLHRVSVLLLNVVMFAVIGVALGAIYGRLFRAPAPRIEEPEL